MTSFRAIAALFLSLAMAWGGVQPALAGHSPSGLWQQVELPTNVTLLDIEFSDTDPQHGWIVGTDATLLETTDGGKHWTQRAFDLGSDLFRFVSVSFAGNEGWIAAKPPLLLHTTDNGKSWNRIALSSRLPGDPASILALGAQTAELVTDVGAIYRTQDAGKTWKALVQQAVGVVRNLNRAPDGRYIAVSAKGNFYSTWSPGDSAWTQHNRNSSRRVNNMGFAPDGRVWMLNRGGQLQFSEPNTLDAWQKARSPRAAKGYSLLDLAFQDAQHVWATGGGSQLLYSEDGGDSWEAVTYVEDTGANFYRIKFFDRDRGYILGQDGTLLAYTPAAS